MCLTINPLLSFRRKARKDISVYKIILQTEGALVTPYRRTIVDIEQPLISQLERTDLMEVHVGIHSFGDMSGAYDEYRNLNLFRNRNRHISMFEIYEAIIPKGAHYYKGRFAGKASYASTELRFGKRVR